MVGIPLRRRHCHSPCPLAIKRPSCPPLARTHRCALALLCRRSPLECHYRAPSSSCNHDRLTPRTPALGSIEAQAATCCPILPRRRRNSSPQRPPSPGAAARCRRRPFRPNSGHQRPHGELLVTSHLFLAADLAGFRPAAPPLGPWTQLQRFQSFWGLRCKPRDEGIIVNL
jgi:hypothetical protein